MTIGLSWRTALAAIEVLDELRDAAGVAEFGAASFAGFGVGGALVGERDLEALVQESHFAQPLRESVVIEFGGGEDGSVGQEMNTRAATLAGAGFPQLRWWDAPLE